MWTSVGERGAALVEVLVALSVLSIAGLAFAELAQAALAGAARAREAEERLLDQDRLLAAYALLDRRDLERRQGTRPVGPYILTIERLDLDLFRVGVGFTGEAPELETVLYRPDQGND